MRLLRCLGCFFLANVASACAQDARYAGDVDGTRALLGLVASDEEVVAYVCDGTVDGVGLAQWFRGAVAPDMSFDIEANGARLEGALASDAARGTFTGTDGLAHTFELGSARGENGLYRDDVSHEDYVGGWIIEDGELRGAVRSVRDGTSHTFELVDDDARTYRSEGRVYTPIMVVAVSAE
jgi:hypothetical protein